MVQVVSPVVSSADGLNRYLATIKRFPLLEPQQEYLLAKRWRERGDRDAAQQLATSHLRLVAKIAMQYRRYGLAMADIISEGNVGLVQAVARFEPERGFRLVTYAMWWIRASIQEFVMRSWSLVKMGTTDAQKRLFFNLQRAKSRIHALDGGHLRPDQIRIIANRFGATERDVAEMDSRMAGDVSLNIPLRDGAETEPQDLLVDETDSQEHKLAEYEEASNRHKALLGALDILNPRERRILEARRLLECPLTLGDLSAEFGVSRERVRQIEIRAFDKLRHTVTASYTTRQTARLT
jgi:RNA polymerase sigma-32 factor